MKAVVAGLFLACVLPPACAAAGLTGTVKSREGKPLSDVEVFSRCLKNGVTDGEGRFTLPGREDGSCGKVAVFFWRPGFRPLIKLVEESAHELHVVLEETTGQEPAVPRCSDVREAGRRVGIYFRVAAPEGASVKRHRSPHGSSHTVRLRPAEGGGELRLPGSQYVYPYPDDDTLLTAQEFTVSVWRLGQYQAVDTRGRRPDGTHWRYFGTVGEALTYDRVTAGAARTLDRLVDGVCYQP